MKWKTLAALSLLGCAAVPDEIELSVGRAFNGDSSLEGWPITQDPTDFVGLGFTYYVGGPRFVRLAPTPREVALDNLTTATLAYQDAEAAVQEVDAPPVGLADDIIQVMSAMDAVSRVIAIGGIFFALWIFRRPIIRLFPFGGGNGNGGKKP